MNQIALLKKFFPNKFDFCLKQYWNCGNFSNFATVLRKRHDILVAQFLRRTTTSNEERAFHVRWSMRYKRRLQLSTCGLW